MTYIKFFNNSFHPAAALAIVAMAALAATAQTPVAHWTFDQGINNYDLSDAIDVVGGYDGVWQDTMTVDEVEVTDFSGLGYTAGQIGGAVRLGGGEDQYFLVPSITELQGIDPTPANGSDPVAGVGISMTAWINVDVDAVDEYKGILVTRTAQDIASSDPNFPNPSTANQNYGLSWEDRPDNANNTESHIDSRVSGQPLDSPENSITRGTWHHVALVWGNVGNINGDTGLEEPSHRLYVDGVLADEDVNSGVFVFLDAANWLIGEDSCCGGREFDGLLDDLAIFDTALSTADIQGIYNDGLTGTDAGGTATGQLVPGDTDGDGVDFGDFEVIRDNLGQAATGRDQGDLTGDRRVDLNDYQQWLQAASPALQSQALASFDSTSVPEPSGLAVMGLALAAMGFSVQRTRSA